MASSTGAGQHGPNWLLLHGTPLHPRVWADVADHLPGSTWAPDISPAPGLTRPQRQIADSLLRPARERGGRWRVVGHSFGGQVALELAATAPDIVDELVVVCSRDTPFPPFAAAADQLDAGAPVDADAALHRWFRPQEIQSRRAYVDDIAEQLQRADRRAWATALRGIAAFDGSAAATTVAVPAVVIAAEHDPVGTPEAMRQLADRLPDAEFLLFEDAAHMSPFLYPERFAAAIDSRGDLPARPPGATG